MGDASSIAVFDQEAVYHFRALVSGKLRSLKQLAGAERFLRVAVMHDDLFMDLQPAPAPPPEVEAELDEEMGDGPRNVILAFGPVLDDFEGVVNPAPLARSQEENASQRLSPRLLELAKSYSGRGEGDTYFEGSTDYLAALAQVLENGGSVLCEGELGRTAFHESEESDPGDPARFLAGVDKAWAEFAAAAHAGLGLVLPPITAIVLSRTASRDKLLTVIRELRVEWADPRRKLWTLIRALRGARTVAEAHDIQRALSDAARLFDMRIPTPGIAPMRFIGDVFTSGMVAGMATLVTSGDNMDVAIATGALAAVAKQAIQSGASAVSKESLSYWLRRGAFDLARRVREELPKVEPIREVLDRHLMPDEKKALGL